MANLICGLHKTPKISCEVLALIAVGFGFSCCGFAQEGRVSEAIVAEVEIQGNNKVPTEFILSKLATQPKSPYRLATATEDVRTLMNLRKFQKVWLDVYPSWGPGRSPGWELVNVRFIVQEFPNEISDLQIRGGEHLRKDQFESLRMIQKGDILSPRTNLIVKHEIEYMYKNRGYCFASVKLVEGGKDSDTRVILDIQEGPQVIIRRVSFQGMPCLFPVARDMFKNCAKEFKQAHRKNIYREDWIENGIDRLKSEYAERGLPDVTISCETHFSEDRKHVDLVFHIE